MRRTIALLLLATGILGPPALADETGAGLFPPCEAEELVEESLVECSESTSNDSSQCAETAALDEPAEEPADPESDHPRLVAAGWCPVRTGAAKEGAPACDVGLGVSLHSWRRWAVVAVVGAETVGAGLAWVVRDGDGPAIAVAAGIVARYDSDGVDGGELYPALGVTLNLGRGGR